MKNYESLFAAYIAVWAIFFAYQITLSVRIGRLRKDLERLKQLVKPE